MFRWHAERLLMLRRWKQELRKHKSEVQGLYGGTVEPTCHCLRGIGTLRKRKPGDCGRAQCGVCHLNKKWSKGNSRRLREYEAFQREAIAYGLG